MTPERRELTDRENKLLAALREAGGWVSRKQLADLIGWSKQLKYYDVILLQRLKNEGLIEIRQQKRKLSRNIYEYKAK